MDLIFSIVVVIIISTYKMTRSRTNIVQATVLNESGVIVETTIEESNFVVGTNLMLRKEPRAYHRILDEMGLG